MKFKVFSIFAVFALALGLLGSAGPASAGHDTPELPIPVDIDPLLKNRPAPAQPSPEEAAAIAAAGPTTTSQCFGDDTALTITIPSFDPANPGDQDVVFFKETPAESTGSATLWVAWDFVDSPTSDETITCDQLEYLQGQMDSIVERDVNYFGEYDNHPEGNPNIDIMIYNIVDESYFDPDFPFYTGGFFWAFLTEEFDRNMVFIDTHDWENRLGPDVLHPNQYEGTVAHELEHLIHYYQDPDEVSWIDEGMADLAEFLNGFGHPASHVVYYMAYHRTPLTLWGGGLEDYGASYLFQLYLLENFGEMGCTDEDLCPTGYENGWTRDEITEQANSIDGVEAATSASFNDLFDAWMVANYLDDPSQTGAGDFPIGYNEIDLTPFVSNAYSPWSIARGITDIYGAGHHGSLPISRYYGGYISGTVEYPIGALPPYAPSYGLYKGIQPEMGIYLDGDAQSGIAPNSGDYEAASGGGNLLEDRMLALNTQVGGTLTFWTWYDIEDEWDYGFVEASTDDGDSWTPLVGSITQTSDNPNASTAWENSLVGGDATTDAAITGNSGGWVEAEFDLTQVSEATDVLIRFSYYTDEAVNGTGWFIDDVATTSGFSEGFEAGSASWDLGGWTVTTGQFDNDWMTGYVNPVYDKGKLQDVEWGYLPSGDGIVDTSNLGKDQATVFFANRPGDSPFDAGYLLLVDKGNASP
jgi:hypothetical protein